MRKVYMAFLLTIGLVVSSCSWAYADTTWDGSEYGGSDVNEDGTAGQKPAKGTFIKKAGDSTVYSVDLTWGELSYDYKGFVVLDETETFYKAAGKTETWVGTGNTITIDNQSEARVRATFAFGLNSDVITGPSVDFLPSNSIDIGTKAIKSDTSSSTCTINMSGIPTKIATTDLKNVTLGTVTVTLRDI
ncbi:MAG: hypothetical protein E7262_01850 [Lachnospiraceae bacterium]|nr:hypothetical protein [Lachnospiraceae bacterium]